jgi:hypothetical protein
MRFRPSLDVEIYFIAYSLHDMSMNERPSSYEESCSILTLELSKLSDSIFLGRHPYVQDLGKQGCEHTVPLYAHSTMT